VTWVYFVSYDFIRPDIGHGFGCSQVVMDRPVTHWSDVAAMRDDLMARESLAGSPVVILNYILLRTEPAS
jgi:hypothetical protein